MAKEYVVVTYGFKRHGNQPCMRDFITETICNGNDHSFESKFFSIVQNDDLLEYNSDYANGHGNFELFGIQLLYREGTYNKGLYAKYGKNRSVLKQQLIEKINAIGLDYNMLSAMYGKPQLYVQSYWY